MVYSINHEVSDGTIQELKDYFRSHEIVFANREYKSSLISKIKLMLIKFVLYW